MNNSASILCPLDKLLRHGKSRPEAPIRVDGRSRYGTERGNARWWTLRIQLTLLLGSLSWVMNVASSVSLMRRTLRFISVVMKIASGCHWFVVHWLHRASLVCVSAFQRLSGGTVSEWRYRDHWFMLRTPVLSVKRYKPSLDRDLHLTLHGPESACWQADDVGGV